MSAAVPFLQAVTGKSGANEAPSETSPLAGKKVLIADRHTSTRMALRDMVSQLGVTSVINANSAGDVIRIVKSTVVDIILCEYKLDEVRDGQQLLEELRHEKLIPLSTMFMMITNERGYKQVIAVAEFAPDDYLLKPFTPEQLYQRLLRAVKKKTIFQKAYQLMDEGLIDEALEECDFVLKAHPKFSADAIRLKIDMLTTVGRGEEAEELLKVIVSNNAVPWAQMGLAVMRFKQDRLEEAEQLLTGLVDQKQEYLAAYDFLAEIKRELGKEHEALEVLERASNLSTFNVKRMRKTAELAAATGDHAKAARVYSKVIERVRDSSLIKAEDFSSLSKAFVAQGKFEDAERVGADLKRTLKGAPDTEITAKLLEYQRYHSAGDHQRADTALLQAVKMQLECTTILPAGMEADLAEACFAREYYDEGFNIARKVATRGGVEKPVLNRIRALLDRYREEQEKRRNTPKVPVNDLTSMLTKLDREGWKDDVARLCKKNIDYWLRKDPNNPEVQAVNNQLQGIMRKYGINAQQMMEGETSTSGE